MFFLQDIGNAGQNSTASVVLDLRRFVRLEPSMGHTLLTTHLDFDVDRLAFDQNPKFGEIVGG
jgi:hypothetical protein